MCVSCGQHCAATVVAATAVAATAVAATAVALTAVAATAVSETTYCNEATTLNRDSRFQMQAVDSLHLRHEFLIDLLLVFCKLLLINYFRLLLLFRVFARISFVHGRDGNEQAAATEQYRLE